MTNILIGMLLGAAAVALGLWAEHRTQIRKIRRINKTLDTLIEDPLWSPFVDWSAPTEAFTPKVNGSKHP